MDFVDSKYVDVKGKGGKVVIELDIYLPVKEKIKEYVSKTENKIDDMVVAAALELIDKALESA